jgi:hypothetical protein
MILALSKDVPPLAMAFGDGWMTVDWDDGLELFARTVSETNVEQYTRFFGQFADDSAIDVPEGFAAALERTKKLAVPGEIPSADVTINERGVAVTAKNMAAELFDMLPCATGQEEELRVRVQPSHLLDLLDPGMRITIDGAGMGVYGPGRQGIVSAVVSSDE